MDRVQCGGRRRARKPLQPTVSTRHRQTKSKVVALVVLVVALGVAVYSATQLLAANRVYAEGNLAYEDLRWQVRKTSISAFGPYSVTTGSGSEGLETAPVPEPRVDIPALEIDFAKMRAINTDAVAWLYCPDTLIDYPVMSATDYNYYLNRLPNGTFNANGSLFIDYNNAQDFSDRLTVIYGHHMQSKAMFGSLVGYKSQRYYNEHPYMYLYTEQGNYRIDLVYGCVIAAGQWRERAFMFSENVDSLLAYAAHNTTFASDTSYAPGDRIVVLSTCSYEFNDARYVVIGVLRSEF